ncbi:MAG: ComEA family DNA-binding protein [Prevotella sp.]
MSRRYYYSSADRRAILVVVLLVVGFSVAMLLFREHGSSSAILVADSTSTDYLGLRLPRNPHRDVHVPDSPQALFAFDPNTADSTALLRLGLQRWQIANIYKYRSKGGVYRKPSDFARLYGLTVHQYRRLEPYIRISAEFTTPASSLFAEETHKGVPDSADASFRRRVPNKIGSGEYVDINVVDTSQLKRVPGIGSYYARRIVQYGERLGGYVSVNQLDEIDDFPAAAKSFFTISTTSSPRKLKVNKLTLVQLRRHPYISYYQARSIVDYRRLHGPFHSLDDLAALPDFTPADIQRLAPYIEF